ncbi:MAG TPA: hypothetical protein VH741_03815 [Candidatus Limnocylindrales bacterium]
MEENRWQQDQTDDKPEYGHDQGGTESGTAEQMTRIGDEGNPSVTDESGSRENVGDDENEGQ